MKKAFYLLFFILASTLAVSAQTSWVKQNLGPAFSVKFPVAPQKLANDRADIYVAKDKDSVGYVATMVDFKAIAGIDSATLAPLKEMPEFRQQLVSGMTQSMPGFDLSPITIGKWNGYTSYALSGKKTSDKTKLQMFIVLIGARMYGLTYVMKESNTSANGPVFFDSCKVEK